MGQRVESRILLIVIALTALLATGSSSVTAQTSASEAREEAAARLTAAVLGDELTEPIHHNVLDLYLDEDRSEYVIVVPRVGDVPDVSDYAEFELPVRIERRDAVEAKVDGIGRMLRQFAKESDGGIAWYYDAARRKVLADGIAPAASLSAIAERYPGLFEYTQIIPDDGPARWWVDESALPLANDARSVPAFLREQGCASGRSPDGRVLEPSVEYRADAIIVSFMVEGLGIARCPGNPRHAVTIELEEAISGRMLLDGSETPPRDATTGDPW